MKSSLLIVASAALLLNAGMAQAAPRDRGMIQMCAPPVEMVTPPTESSVPPPSIQARSPGRPSSASPQ